MSRKLIYVVLHHSLQAEMTCRKRVGSTSGVSRKPLVVADIPVLVC